MVTRASKPQPLAAWMEDTLRLPSALAASAGPIKLHPYQRAIVDAIADPKVGYISMRTAFHIAPRYNIALDALKG